MKFNNILAVDAQISARMRVAEHPGLLRWTAAFLAHSGDSWFWGAGLILVWVFGSSFWKHWSLVVFGGIAVLAVIVMSIKFTVRRRRPEGEWGLIYRSTDPHSFPSGHAARVFLIAVLVSGLGPTWLAVVFWIWAPLVALARVSMGVHYVSDILAGTLLGIALGLVALAIQGSLLGWLTGLVGIPLW
jgi:undecaprenyl-diphosphatase